MAKFKCVCGTELRIGGLIPNPIQWNLIADDAISTQMWDDDVEFGEIYSSMTMMFRCPVSDHLWVFWDGIEAPPGLYSPATLDTKQWSRE